MGDLQCEYFSIRLGEVILQSDFQTRMPLRRFVGGSTSTLERYAFTKSEMSCATGFVKSLSVQYSVCEMGFHEVNNPPALI